jgi:hypothetical protein
MRLLVAGARWIAWTLAIPLAISLSTVGPSHARAWPRGGPSASDYLLINDNRGNGEVVLVYWIAPPMMPAASQAARDLLDKYIVIGVVHAHGTKEGSFTFDRPSTLEARGAQDEPLQSLDMDTMPPAVVGTLAVLKSSFSRSLGTFGQGMQWFVFGGGSVHACSKGGMAVLFADEKYTYVTPVPGCPTT